METYDDGAYDEGYNFSIELAKKLLSSLEIPQDKPDEWDEGFSDGFLDVVSDYNFFPVLMKE